MIVGERGAATALARADGLGSRGSQVGDGETTDTRDVMRLARPPLGGRWGDAGGGLLGELVVVLLRSRSPEARRLGRAIVGSSARERLEAGDLVGFRAEVIHAAGRLWPGEPAPFPVCWALQAAGILPLPPQRASG